MVRLTERARAGAAYPSRSPGVRSTPGWARAEEPGGSMAPPLFEHFFSKISTIYAVTKQICDKYVIDGLGFPEVESEVVLVPPL